MRGLELGTAGLMGCFQRGKGWGGRMPAVIVPLPLLCPELGAVLQSTAAVLGISQVIPEGSHCTQTNLKELYL